MAANPDNIIELNQTLFDFAQEQDFADQLKSQTLKLVYGERTMANWLRQRLDNLRSQVIQKVENSLVQK
jgi:hypothetical protein